jgi:hypothetical protein
MNDEERIQRIQQARTPEELEQATDGYRREVIAAHPLLEGNRAFGTSMDRGQYFHALGDVRRAARGGGDQYRDVIRVLEHASQKQLSLKTF